MSEIIRLKNVSIRRDGKPVLKGVSWSTHPGEHWFIMGPNGSGKTTLSEILMGYLWPQEGEVKVLGGRFGHVLLQDIRANVGYVAPWIFKRTSFETPVEDVVASGMDASIGGYGPKDDQLRVALKEQLVFFGCEELSGRAFGTLSSGQQLKVVLARALVHDPALLVLDEPFSLLDVGARVKMYTLLEKIARHKTRTQMVVVTHHMEDVLPFLTHGLVLKDGRVLAQGERGGVLRASVLAPAFDVSEQEIGKYFNL